MEAYVIGIGMIPCLEQWEKDLQAVKLPFRYDKDKPKCLIRLSVDKIQLYKIKFPEEHLEAVSQLLGITNYIPKRFAMIRRAILVFRKVLRLDELKVPEKILDKFKHIQPDGIKKAVAIIPLGTRKDMFTEKGMEML